MGKLEDLRREIDEIDAGIVALIARRMGFVEEIREYKQENGLNIVDAEREGEIYERVRGEAVHFGADPDLVTDVFKLLIQYARQMQVVGR